MTETYNVLYYLQWNNTDITVPTYSTLLFVFCFGLHLMTTGLDSPKILIISHFKSLVAVPTSTSTGTEGDN